MANVSQTQHSTTATRTTRLPGVDNSLVIPSEPMLVREDFKERKPKKERSKRWNIFKFFGWE
ncbi:hypothetical protein DLD77_01635 [Chitinophaga alhagiae]|uniref:Uncharacterized protein n=1 Tax=Chitinophaga alhagiae TaxID=2203219 RepID=A0ABM6W948_9BACT|nr:hypothetical protein [Chitinophaga alhagiae]AWO00497.1 hypothetical protein DLD77_01635 [Chitinophaga alhagiae]